MVVFIYPFYSHYYCLNEIINIRMVLYILRTFSKLT